MTSLLYRVYITIFVNLCLVQRATFFLLLNSLDSPSLDTILYNTRTCYLNHPNRIDNAEFATGREVVIAGRYHAMTVDRITTPAAVE